MKNRVNAPLGAVPLVVLSILTVGVLAALGISAGGRPGPDPERSFLFPRSAAGRTAAAYFLAFNAGDDSMKAFFEKYAAKDSLQKNPVPVRLDRYRQMHAQLGSLEPLEVVAERPGSIVVAARPRDGARVRLEFELEAAEPHGLLGIRVQAGGGPGEEGPPAQPKKDDAELLAAVKDYVGKAVEAGDFSGVILIARNGAPIFSEAYGLADREKKIPNRTDTKFNIGSIDKAFTALAVRELASEKKLSLDDTIGKFLPDYPNKDAAARATVGQLLDMSSGIGDFFGDRYEAADKEKILTLADYLPLFADRALAFEPGKGNQYSNGGYIVLGLIIEKVTGVDYYSYIRDNIFLPAGMNDSEWTAKGADVPNRAVGYVREGGSWKTNYDTLPGKGSSAGGGYSTAADLLKYTIALGKKLFGPAGEEGHGGMGIAGGAPGLNAALEWMPERGVTIVVLANMSPPAATRVAARIRSWLPR